MARGSAIATTVSGEAEVDEPFVDEPELVEEEGTLEESAADEEAARIAEIEARARRSGWRPLAEYRGRPGEWVDAETFEKRGQTFLPMVQKDLREERARTSRLEAEIAGLRGKIEEQGVVLQDLRRFALNANEAGYQRAKAELEARQRAAVTEGDTQAFDEIKEQIDALEEGRAERPALRETPPPAATPPPNPQPKPAVDIKPEVEAFIVENPWFMQDRVLNAAMTEAHVRLNDEMPGLTLAENLERAKEKVMADFPHKFGIDTEAPPVEPAPVRPRARTVTPSRPQTPSSARGRGLESITDPAEREQARRAYQRTKTHIPDMTEAEYMLLYNNPRADIIEIRRAKQRATR